MGLVSSKKNMDQLKSTDVSTLEHETSSAGIDPRSPSANVLRTPLNWFKLPRRNYESMNNTEVSIHNETPTTRISPAAAFKHRLLRSLGYNPQLDPRSPSNTIVRTPIVFKKDENAVEVITTLSPTSFQLEITNDDESTSFEAALSKIESDFSAEMDQLCESFSSSSVSAISPKLLLETNFDGAESTTTAIAPIQDAIDPRSPTPGLLRTPIVLPETEAAQIVIRQTQTVRMFQSEVVVKEEPEAKENEPQRKSLDRLRSIYRGFVRKDQIYTDLMDEDGLNADQYSTPIKKASTPLRAKNRTPLSCVLNRKPTGSGVLVMETKFDATPKTDDLISFDNAENTPASGKKKFRNALRSGRWT